MWLHQSQWSASSRGVEGGAVPVGGGISTAKNEVVKRGRDQVTRQHPDDGLGLIHGLVSGGMTRPEGMVPLPPSGPPQKHTCIGDGDGAVKTAWKQLRYRAPKRRRYSKTRRKEKGRKRKRSICRCSSFETQPPPH